MDENDLTPIQNNNGQQLAPKAAQTTKENPWPLAHLSQKIKGYVDKMVPTWVEGQIVEYKQRPANRMTFFVVKDLEAEMSMQVKAFGSVISAAGPGLEAGARVIMQVKPDYYLGNGQLALMASQIHTVGLGVLLQQIEQLRKQLQSEGLFDPQRRLPLPFIPKKVGLICGRGAKAKDDVIVNATKRWPGINFEIRQVAVQGPSCPPEVTAALRELDQREDIDLIVITRGGGSVEDLLGFSDETLVRAAADAKTPIVAAIGHESDTPLLDYVVDFRASTPTDAAKRIVPDLQEQLSIINEGQERLRLAVTSFIQQSINELTQLKERPVMINPQMSIEKRKDDIHYGATRLHAAAQRIISQQNAQIAQMQGTLKALSPRATLQRGYAVLRLSSKEVITNTQQVKNGDLIEALLASGSLIAQVKGATKDPKAQNQEQDK